MDITQLVAITNEYLAGETLMYPQLEKYYDHTIDDINAKLNANFPSFSNFNAITHPQIYPNYIFFPDTYIRSVVALGAAYYFYLSDEEGAATAQQYGYNYQDNLFIMERDYLNLVDPQYKASNRGYVNTPEPSLTDPTYSINPDIRYIPGPQGPMGPMGPVGPQGKQGLQGPRGPEGPEGKQGPPGEQGPAGNDGPQGARGETGLQGPRGYTGATGPQGERGLQGLKGDTGEKGETGPQGPPGPWYPCTSAGSGAIGVYNITSNNMYIFGEVSTLELVANMEDTTIANEAIVIFTSGATPTVLTIDETYKWFNGLPIQVRANKTYMLSFIYDGSTWFVVGGEFSAESN